MSLHATVRSDRGRRIIAVLSFASFAAAGCRVPFALLDEPDPGIAYSPSSPARVERERMEVVSAALMSEPVDREALADALRDVAHVSVECRGRRPLEDQNPSRNRHLRPVRGPDGKLYGSRSIHLNRAEGGAVPDAWLDELCSLGERDLVFRECGGLGFAVAPELIRRRRLLLRRAHGELLSGLRRLLADHPVLSAHGDPFALLVDQSFDERPDHLSITLVRGPGNLKIRTGPPVPDGYAFRFVAWVDPTSWGVPEQISPGRLFSNLELEGFLDFGAADEELDEALGRLREEAFRPLEELNESAQRRTGPLRR